MKPIKILALSNVIFLCVTLVFLSKAYLGGYEELSYKANKIEAIEHRIKTETKIEKLREIALLSFATQNSLSQATDSVVKAAKAEIQLFSVLFTFNILFLLIFLRQKIKANLTSK